MDLKSEISQAVAHLSERNSPHILDEDQKTALLEALKTADEKQAILDSIINFSDDAIISKDLSGNITSWNAAAGKIFGYTPDEIIGTSITRLIPPERLSEEEEILAKLKAGQRIEHFETKRLHKNGTIIDVLLTISPVKNSYGEVVGVSKIARDITIQNLYERNSGWLSAIVESSDDAIISKNFDSIITSWNKGAERIFGYTALEMIGFSILRLIPEDRLQEEPEILAKLRAGSRVDHFETIRLHKSGELIHVSLSISPIRNKAGEIVGLSKIARDITDKKVLENKKDEFISFISHELKTPLTSLRSYVQIALLKTREAGLDFVVNALSRAEKQTRKMENILSDFLNVSRLKEGKMILEKTQFDLVTLIKENVTDAALSAKQEIIYEGVEQASVYADAEKIGMVLTNLINNAIKYSPGTDKIIVSCNLSENNFIVAVQDFGIGISLENQQGLFTKFNRIRTVETKSIGGFGIGLYLSASIISLHNAVIKIQSEPGKGSTFSFSLRSL
ncbi:PAS domain S-box protein [Pedobacter aquatilis]|uniref:PAS domain S-box protein n=1 Tax=Pedobacter aquatilis TaxID=351343 RepID=UPI00292D2987|nr:PAS domain S-box protein [Pedobacter aquatilis]